MSDPVRGFELSPQQRDLWAVGAAAGGRHGFALATLRIEGALDGQRLRRALEGVVAEQEILRTRFVRPSGLRDPLQVIDDGAAVDWRVVDPGEGADTAAVERELAAEAIDPAAGPPLVARLVRVGSERHDLILRLPALAADAVGLDRLVDDLVASWDGRLEPAEVQYADVAAALDEILDEEGAAPGRELWRRRGVRPGPSGPGSAPRRIELPLGLGTGALERLPMEPVDAIAAALALSVARTEGTGAATLGTVAEGRAYEGLAEAAGTLARLLPLDLEIEPGETFLELVERLAGLRRAGEEWQDYFTWQRHDEELRETVGTAAGGAARLAHGVGIEAPRPVHQTADGPVFRLTTRWVWTGRTAVQVVCRPREDGVEGEILFDPSLADERAVRRLAHALAATIEAAVETPERRVEELPVLSRAERHRLVVELNDTAGSIPWEAMPDSFSRQAATTPQAVAVADGERRITYAALARQADGLRARLQAAGVGPGDRVGLHLDRSVEALAGVLAILASGAAYVPLDPSLPAARLAFLLEDSGARHVLVDTPLPWPCPTGVETLEVRLTAESDDPAPPPAPHVGPRMAPEDLAYVLYTSGTTGRPKGVMVTHGGLANYLAWCRRAYLPERSPGRGAALHSSLGFDLTVTSLLAPLTAGRQVRIAAPGPGIEPLLDALAPPRPPEDGDLELLKLTPAHLELLGTAGDDRSLVGARTLVVGGEPLRAEAVAAWRRICPDGRVVNEYGPTEAVVGCTVEWVEPARGPRRGPVSIGRPITNARIHVTDRALAPLPVGALGEILIGGVGLARGYTGRPAATAERFVPDPFATAPGARLYKTGDLARWHEDGRLDFQGRTDDQVKVRGHRIEPAEIAAVLEELDGIDRAVVVATGQGEAERGDLRLVAYLVSAEGAAPPADEVLRAALGERLPEPMIPTAFVPLDALPLTANGKVDRAALPEPTQRRRTSYVAPTNELEQRVAEIWREVLGVERIGRDDNFFDLGGHSFLAARVHRMLRGVGEREATMVDLFRHPTLRTLADFLAGDAPAGRATRPARRASGGNGPIAIIGMSGRFPKARDVDELWRNLCDGLEAITFFERSELLETGIDPEVLDHPDFVGAKAVLEEADRFDAGFFAMSPREAETTDPQQRILLECAWSALEDSGYAGDAAGKRIGVFTGVSVNRYGFVLAADPRIAEDASGLGLLVGNDKDFASTRVAYKLDLRGPALTVQTACSTSLVAVHQACRSLAAGECDLALAGGASVRIPQISGHVHHEGGIATPDGHCRPFDIRARGTIGGNGVGVVVLKRLDDAVADGDTVRAIIRGSAINNDGALKMGFTAPSIQGQAEVIAAAHAAAGVEPETIGYVEAHGTATELGDPIEVAALVEALGADADDSRVSCAIGSVKSNLGHLDAAAGVTGLIKAVLCLEREAIPPSLHFEEPNPRIDFADGRLFVNDALRPWPRGDDPRRAGVSAFGIGGTNVHVVLEEAPAAPADEAGDEPRLLTFSARSPAALGRTAENLARFLTERPETRLDDLAFTLAVGRRAFEHRATVVAGTPGEAVEALEGGLWRRGAAPGETDPEVVFLFPGQGAQHPAMGAGLYRHEPVFRAHLDRCSEILEPILGRALPALLGYGGEAVDPDELARTEIAQPVLFAVELALARTWMERGVTPTRLVGHSLGEYVAACLAGVFEIEAALELVATRGRLMQQAEPGSMLALALAPDDARALVERAGSPVVIAAINAPDRTVVAGSDEAIEELRQSAARAGGDPAAAGRRLHTSHAFHSPMMDPILDRFAEAVAAARPRPPRLPVLSNPSGDWLTEEQTVDPRYWARQLREPVRFADGVEAVLRAPGGVFLEIGPGGGLGSLARRQMEPGGAWTALSSLPGPSEPRSEHGDLSRWLDAVGGAWRAGVPVDWHRFWSDRPGRRIPAPTYPFERQRYWAGDERVLVGGAPARPAEVSPRTELADWFYLPSWRRALAPAPPEELPGQGIVLGDGPLADAVAAALTARGGEVVSVRSGHRFEALDDRSFRLDPSSPEDHRALLERLGESGARPRRLVHLWTAEESASPGGETDWIARGFDSLMALGTALSAVHVGEALDLMVVAAGLRCLAGEAAVVPDKAPLLGPVEALPFELPGLVTSTVDIAPGTPSAAAAAAGTAALAERLVAELGSEARSVVLRHGGRWVAHHEPVRIERPAGTAVRPGDVVLVTGGLGGIGSAVVHHLAGLGARLVIVGRSPLTGPEADAETAARLESLEATGAEVLARSADVTDRAAMAAVVAEAIDRFGTLDLVVHGAGVAGGSLVAETPLDEARRVLAPKVQGTRVLQAVVPQGVRWVLFSSLATVLPGPARASYLAANAFLEAFAEAAVQAGTSACAISWDTWRETGMAVDEARRQGLAADGESLRSGMSTAQGLAVLDRSMAAGVPRMVVSVSDLATRQKANAARLTESTTEGELDRPTPQHSRPELSTPYQAPRDAAEAALAEIWSSLLGVEPIGVHDNFFELGGDSVVGIQMAARARQAELTVHPRQLFELQTIALLAAAASTTESVVAEQGPVTGRAPLGPIQAWLLDELDPVDVHHWNQSTLFEARTPLDATGLAHAVDTLLAHHDALRTRFLRIDGTWRQSVDPPGATPPVSRIDLGTAADPEAAFTATAARLQESLDLEAGPVVRVALFDLGGDAPQRLLVIAHHLVVDAISWRIVLEDLATAYGQWTGGEPMTLPAKTTSFLRWTERLAEHADADSVRAEAQLWTDPRRLDAAPLPVDVADGPNLEASAQRVACHLDRDATERLRALGRSGAARVDELLLAALATTLAEASGGRPTLVHLEGNGREPLFDDVDLSRTVGWFTSLVPVLLDAAPEGQPPEATLRSVRRELGRFAAGGLGHGLLRHLGSDRELAARLAAMPRPEVSFLYLGQADSGDEQAADAAPALAPLRAPVGPPRSPRARRAHRLDVTARIVDSRLEVGWNFASDLLRPATVDAMAQRFVDALEALLDRSDELVADSSIVAAHPLCARDPEGARRLLDRIGPVDDLYPLSPLQRGLLFHALDAPESGAYVQHLTGTIVGPLDVDAFAAACAEVVRRHPVLRTSFHWIDLDEPLQAVHPEAPLPLEHEDWSELPEDERDRRFDDLLRADRRRSFLLSEAPLMRLHLVRLDPERHRFLWSHHHLILDGWSIQLVLAEMLRLYGENEVVLTEARPYAEYVAWLEDQDLEEARAYWSEALAEAAAPTLLATRAASGEELADYEERRTPLSEELTAALRQRGRRHQLTLNTLVLGAWSLVLGRLVGRDAVTFASVVSGRPAELADIESRVGLFINALPSHVRWDREESWVDWLARLQRQQAAMRRFEYSALSEILRWSGLPRDLFDTLFVFESYPVPDSLGSRQSLEIVDVRSMAQENYPFIVEAMPREELLLGVRFDRRRIETELAERALRHLVRLLERMARDGASPVARLADELERWDQDDRRARAQAFGEADRQALGRLRRRARSSGGDE